MKKDFFVSYTHSDLGWAMGISTWLRSAGYSVVMQDSDFAAGSNFVLEMDKALKAADRTIAVLSPAYLQSSFTAPEWAEMFRRDPKGDQRLLIPVRVIACELQGLLASIVYVDLVGVSVEKAEQLFLDALKGKAGEKKCMEWAAEDPKTPLQPSDKHSPNQVINGDGNIQAGGDVFIETKKVVRNQVTREEGEISDQQAQEIKELVSDIASFEAQSGARPSYGKWYKKLQNTFGCTSYKKIREKDFESAVSWLRQQKPQLRPKLRRTNNAAWRKDYYKSIYARWRQLGKEKEEIYTFAKERLTLRKSILSLKDLGERNLKKLDGIVSRLQK